MAQGIDYFFKGLDRLTDGIKESRANDIFKASQEEYAKIQGQAMDQEKQQQALNNLSFQMATSLAAAGVDATKIANTAGQIGISQSAMFQAQENMKRQVQAENFKREQMAFQGDLEMRKAQLKAKGEASVLPDFIVDPRTSLEKEDLKKLKNVNAASRRIFSQVANVKALLNEVGTFELWNRKDYAKLKSSLTQLQLEAKNEDVFGLGVLTGPDLSLLEDAVGAVGANPLNRNSTVEARLNQFTKNMITNLNSQASARGVKLDPNSDLNDLMLKARVSPSNAKNLDAINMKFAGDPKLLRGVKAALSNPQDPRAQMLLQKLNIDVNDLLGD